MLGTDARRNEAWQGLTAAAGYIRKELGLSLPLRYIPSLTFVADASLQLSEAIARAAAATPPDSAAIDANGESQAA